MYRLPFVLSIAMVPALLVGCGGGVETGPSTTTTSSSSTTTTPPLPATPDAAWSVSLMQDDPLKCQVASHQESAGQLDASQVGAKVFDGQDMANVTCTVLGSGPFAVHGKSDTQATASSYLEVDIPALTPQATKSNPADGTLEFSAAWTAGQPYAGTCKFYFVPGTPETVATGKVWAAFTCDGLNGGMSTCPLAESYLLFENCLTDGAP